MRAARPSRRAVRRHEGGRDAKDWTRRRAKHSAAAGGTTSHPRVNQGEWSRPRGDGPQQAPGPSTPGSRRSSTEVRRPVARRPRGVQSTRRQQAGRPVTPGSGMVTTEGRRSAAGSRAKHTGVAPKLDRGAKASRAPPARGCGRGPRGASTELGWPALALSPRGAHRVRRGPRRGKPTPKVAQDKAGQSRPRAWARRPACGRSRPRAPPVWMSAAGSKAPSYLCLDVVQTSRRRATLRKRAEAHPRVLSEQLSGREL